MSFIRAVVSALRNFANFNGRANRREFWYWLAFVVIVYLLIRYFELNVLTRWSDLMPYEEPPQFPAWLLEHAWLTDNLTWLPDYLTWISWGWLIICILPTLSLVIRRVHDHDQPGWMALTIIPLVWWLVAKGTKGPNRYG
jgi:uncharacterized membrane protein YhaH (DUF805 family)